METITAHSVFLIVLIGNRIDESLGFHGLMECCIKYTNHGSGGKEFLAGTHTNQCGRIVKGSKRIELFYGIEDFLSQQGRACELLAAVYHTMSNGINFVHGLENTGLGIAELL